MAFVAGAPGGLLWGWQVHHHAVLPEAAPQAEGTFTGGADVGGDLGALDDELFTHFEGPGGLAKHRRVGSVPVPEVGVSSGSTWESEMAGSDASPFRSNWSRGLTSPAIIAPTSDAAACSGRSGR